MGALPLRPTVIRSFSGWSRLGDPPSHSFASSDTTQIVVAPTPTVTAEPDYKTIIFDSTTIFEAARKVSKERKCKESFEIIISMNVNPTKSDQNIRGTCILPSGLGNVIRICAFASEEFHSQIKEIGVE